jgi:hypothetical protein
MPITVFWPPPPPNKNLAVDFLQKLCTICSFEARKVFTKLPALISMIGLQYLQKAQTKSLDYTCSNVPLPK